MLQPASPKSQDILLQLAQYHTQYHNSNFPATSANQPIFTVLPNNLHLVLESGTS